MSDASEKLARTRLAIIAHIQAKERRHERRDPAFDEDDGPPLRAEAAAAAAGERVRHARDGAVAAAARVRGTAAGWLGRTRSILRTWWRHHPASMGVDIAKPMLRSYAARSPVQYLAIAAAAGGVIAVTRPWRLVSATGLLVALLKSSQLSSLVMSAMAGADFGEGSEPPP